ncbi:integrase core domain-containing protein [Streptomyces sp. NPDC102467]|uniref:integrase core domain-containing protein n=1 Tax=Streptomyces sp. NPDC102467 TaxID=3366179 RepID=UPI00382F9B05
MSSPTAVLHRPVELAQYRAIRYTERLADEAAVASVGSKGDSYDNALAEAFNSLFKAELIRNKGPWTSVNDVEIAVAEYVDWFNQRRLHGDLAHVTPAEHEAAHYAAEPPASLQETS